MEIKEQPPELDAYLVRLEETLKEVETLEQARILSKEIKEVEQEMLDLEKILQDKDTFTPEQKKTIWESTRRLRFGLPFVFTALLSFAPFFNKEYSPVENSTKYNDIYKNVQTWMSATKRIFSDIESYEEHARRREYSKKDEDLSDTVFFDEIAIED